MPLSAPLFLNPLTGATPERGTVPAFPCGEAHAMADSLPRRILATLAKEGPLTVPELAERLGVPGPLVGGVLEHLQAGRAVAKAGGRLVPYPRGGGHRWLSLWAVAERG